MNVPTCNYIQHLRSALCAVISSIAWVLNSLKLAAFIQFALQF